VTKSMLGNWLDLERPYAPLSQIPGYVRCSVHIRRRQLTTVLEAKICMRIRNAAAEIS